jgi:hypothetical protein
VEVPIKKQMLPNLNQEDDDDEVSY